MNCIIITIGDELLIGQTIDTNSAWMGKELNKNGVWVMERLAIGDDKEQIKKALEASLLKADLILITGGLGPTKDDITKKVLCEFFKGTLIIDNKVLEHVSAIFAKRNLPLLDTNRQQALVPDNCEVLYNDMGTAPGMKWQQGEKTIVSLPGVPHEMKHLMSTYILPQLESETSVEHLTLITTGIGESMLAHSIENWENELPTNIKLAYLPSPGMVKLRLTARGNKSQNLAALLEGEAKKVKPMLGKYLFAEKDVLPEEAIGELLTKKNLTLALAESCTGGYIASKIVSLPGSSSYFDGGVVAYSYAAKKNLLGVSQSILDQQGAVSEDCVLAMCEGALNKFGSDYVVAVSGIAGPGGAQPNKPVGTVWIGVGRKNHLVAKKHFFGSDRTRNIELSFIYAITMLKQAIEKE